MHDQYEIDVEVDHPVATVFEADGGDVAWIIEAVEATLRRHNVFEGEVAILLTDDAQIQRFNRDYRGVDAPTDIVSFPQHDESLSDDEEMDMPDELAEELDRQLGDLAIAYPYTVRQAQRYGTSIESELRLLAVHGTLHLLGYDHATPEEKSAMWAAQNAALADMGEEPHVDRQYD